MKSSSRYDEYPEESYGLHILLSEVVSFPQIAAIAAIFSNKVQLCCHQWVESAYYVM
jgi:hypothetical protein